MTSQLERILIGAELNRYARRQRSMVREAHRLLDGLVTFHVMPSYCTPGALRIVVACARWRGLEIGIKSTLNLGERCFRISLRDEKAKAA